MNLANLSNSLDLLKRSLGVSILKIKEDGVIEENSVLGDDRHIFAERVERHLSNVLAVNENTTLRGIIDTEEQVE